MNLQCYLFLFLTMAIPQWNFVLSLSVGGSAAAAAGYRSKEQKMLPDTSKPNRIAKRDHETGGTDDHILPPQHLRPKTNFTDPSTIVIKTHVLWRPSDDEESDEELEPSKLVILPLGAFLALIIGTCIKISHWWNEDIREADGMLENIYTPKNPQRRILARVLSIQHDPRKHVPTGKPDGTRQQGRFYKKYRRRSKVVPELLPGSQGQGCTGGHHCQLGAAGCSHSDKEELDSDCASSPELPLVPTAAGLRDIFQLSQPMCTCDINSSPRPSRFGGGGDSRGPPPPPQPCRQESFISLQGSRSELIPLLPLMYSVTPELPPHLQYDVSSPVVETTNVSFPPPPPPPAVSQVQQAPKRAAREQGKRSKAKAKHQNKKALPRDIKPTRRKRRHGLVTGSRPLPPPHGVSKLVLDSLSFNLHLMQLAMEEEEDITKRLQQQTSSSSSPTHTSISPPPPPPPHRCRCCQPGTFHLEHGYIEDSFIHPGESSIPKAPTCDGNDGSDLNSLSPCSTENTALLSSSAQSSVASIAPWSSSPPVRSRAPPPFSRKDSANALLTSALLESISKGKPSVSSFSSVGTSSTSLSRSTASQLGDSRLFYHIASQASPPGSSPDRSDTCGGSETTISDTGGSMKKSQTSSDIVQDRDYAADGAARGHKRPRSSSLRRKESCAAAADRPVFFIV